MRSKGDHIINDSITEKKHEKNSNICINHLEVINIE